MKVAEIAILTFAFICGGLAIYWGIKANSVVMKPCSVSEISPDFLQRDRENCRIMRGHKL